MTLQNYTNVKLFYYIHPKGYESDYAVNYKEAAIKWFKDNNYQIIETDAALATAKGKITLYE